MIIELDCGIMGFFTANEDFCSIYIGVLLKTALFAGYFNRALILFDDEAPPAFYLGLIILDELARLELCLIGSDEDIC